MMDDSTLKDKKTAAIYIHGRTDLMPRGKKLLTEEDAQPLIEMIKRELPKLEFVATYVDGRTEENKNDLLGCKAWNSLIRECKTKKLDYVVVPSLGSLPYGASDAPLLLQSLEYKFPSTKIYFLLENICTGDVNFISAVSFELTAREWANDRKNKKNKLIRKIIS